MRKRTAGAAAALLAALLVPLLAPPIAHGAQAKPTVITLTQTGCQFIEPEGQDRGFKTRSAKDCNAINKKSGEKRLSASKPLSLKPGKYIFRVTNKNVPYELGFYLRGTGIRRFIMPKVSGGGLTTGKTQEYAITLKEGSYVYSCPLKPTPDYPLIVKK
jgi:hypothetical protein